jgi:hypothetical protein
VSCRLALLLPALAGCGAGAGARSDDSAAGGGAADTIQVVLERGPCYGTCPVYAVTVRGDGTILLDARRHLDTTGTIERRVPGAEVAALMRLMEESGFFGLEASYTLNRFACRPYVTDAALVVIEARVGARHKRVEHDLGCGGAPAALLRIEQRLDSLGGLARWTSGGRRTAN